MTTRSTATCPESGAKQPETMPTGAWAAAGDVDALKAALIEAYREARELRTAI